MNERLVADTLRWYSRYYGCTAVQLYFDYRYLYS